MKYATILGLGVLAASTATYAGPYIAGSATVSDRKDSAGFETDPAYGGKLSAGYRWEGLPLMFELSYFDSGKADIKNSLGADAKYSGVQASLGYFGRLDSKGSGLWATGGYYSGDVEVRDPGAVLPFPGSSIEESTNGLVLGVGGVWKITRHFGLQAGADVLFGVEDFNEDENLLVVHTGLVFELTGGSAAPAHPTYMPPPPPPPAPAYTPAPAPAPVAAPQPVPAAPAPTTVKPDLPGGMAATGVRLTAQPTMLLRQPRSGAPVDGNIPAGAEVQLLQRVPNAQGVWWYVSYNGNTGWVSDIALK